MMPAAPLRLTSAVAVGVVLAAGLVTTPPAATPPAAAAPLPPGSETFAVSGDHGGTSENAFMTSDAQHVVFTSTATDLVAGDTNGVADIFLANAAEGSDDPFSGTPVLVSAPDGPVGAARANAASDQAVASIDGRYVAFTSAATNLVNLPSAGDGRTYIYVRDTVKNTTIRIQAAAEPDGSSSHPDLSDDGRYLVFTSDATNLWAPGSDVNGVADSFIVDLDANGDGLSGDLHIERVIPDASYSAGIHDIVISGNGRVIAYLSRSHLESSADLEPSATDNLYFSALQHRSGALQTLGLLATFVDDDISGRVSIDATGVVFAYVKTRACEQDTAVVATSYVVGGAFRQAVGTILADLRSGTVADPVISADGSTVAWSTTVPAYDFGNGGVPSPPLAEPVIRVQGVSWWDASGGEEVQCSGVLAGDWYDVADGSRPSVSASGRTIAFHSPAPSRVYAVDRHTTEGLSVTSIEGEIMGPPFVTQMPISSISVASLRGYAAALADSPIYRLPIYRLPIYRLPIYRLPIYRLLVDDSPIYRLPIYRLPIYRLPIYRLDLPGGWPQVLEGTPFADDLIQTVTLDEVLKWANENPQTDAGIRIHSLTLADVGLEGSGLESLSLASYALGNAPVSALQVPGTGSNLERWQSLADAQGLRLTVDAETVLAELDAAGLDIASTGIAELALSGLSAEVLDQTLLGSIRIAPELLPGTPVGAIGVSTLDAPTRTALFGTAAVTGTLADPSTPLSDDATFADLAAGAPALKLGDVLFSLLDAESYPWEQISTSVLDPRLATGNSGASCVSGQRCGLQSSFRFTFDAGPGESTLFPAPTASITLPAGTRPTQIDARGSGPGVAWFETTEYGGPLTIDGGVVTAPMADTRAGTVFELRPAYSVATYVGQPTSSATLTSGNLHAEGELGGDLPQVRWDDAAHNWSPESGWVEGEGVTLEPGNLYYEWISPAWLGLDDYGQQTQGPAADEDYYYVDAPGPGQRLVISTNASDGQVSLSLYGPQGAGTSAATLGLANAGPVPGTPVTEQSAAGAGAQAGADAGVQIQGQTLIDQVVQRGSGTAAVEAASTDAAAGSRLLVRVTSGNGQPSSALYSLRVQYLDDAVETVCPALPPVDDAPVAVSDPVTADTNTLYLVDTARYDATYGAGSADAVRAGLESLTGSGHVGDGTVQGAVLSVDADARVRAARAALDANPCSMQARKALVAAINTYVAEQVGANRDGISSVVVVGGDDIIPFAPVAQHTSQFTEQSHAADLRLTGAACPGEVADGALDACATPLSAAAAASMILTDDPYGLARAYESLGGYLYVPTTALGRLVESPDDILATVARFTAADGVLAADSTVTGGYGAWSELPDEVTSSLSWRSASNTELGSGDPDGLWDLGDVTEALFPDSGDAPKVVSINTHADEKRMLPGIQGAEDGVFADADLFTTDSVTDAGALAGSLIFLIGCHAGDNLPSAYYGADAKDWVDVFSQAGGYVGNTGYGLANNITTALGERLLALYADWIGVEADGQKVSASGALTYAKQSYLGGLGLYSGYDEKVLMEAVYYGLPMYTFADAATTRQAPVPEIPADLQALQTSSDGLSTAGLSLNPAFQKKTAQDATGTDVSYLTADGQEPAVVSGQPVLPKLVAQLRDEPGKTPRGALITGLSSQTETGVTPAIATPDVGVAEKPRRADAAFPSSFATITRQDTPEGTADFLVVTPGRVTPALSGAGTGTLERFTHLDLDVVYGPSESTDTTAPVVSALESRGGVFQFSADGTGSSVARAVLLLQYGDDEDWVRRDATESSGTWRVQLPDDSRPYRWILQVADLSGNVAVETNRGQLPVEQPAEPPSLGDPGGAATVAVGGELRRTVEVTGVAVGDALTGRVVVTADGQPAATSTATVSTGNDGRTRASIAQGFSSPGDYVVTLTVCRGTTCASTDIPVHVPTPNTAPAATVTLSASTVPAGPDAVLTAHATGSDPDGDPVTLAYAWTRNGAPLTGRTSSSLSLADIGATPGDVIAVIVTPSDPHTAGHAASADVTVATPPAPPQITASATDAAGPYVEGTWSRTPVTVVFACTGPAVLDCSAPQTVSADTTSAGVVVTGTVHDLLGRSAAVQVLVKVDATAPVLAPSVTPPAVPQGGSATAAANARDASSGVATQSCDTPQTSTPGAASVACRATDNAGNTASGTAAYTVLPPAAKLCKGVPDRAAQIPLAPDGSSVFLRTSGVPITFRACDANGKPIGTKNFVKSVTQVSVADLPKNAKITELWYIPITGFAYVKAVDAWIGQISTVKLAGGKKYTYRVNLADGTSFTFTFGVR